MQFSWQNKVNSVFLILKTDSIQSRANRKFKLLTSVLSNRIIKTLEYPSFNETSNSKVPGKFGKNILLINSKFIFWMTGKIVYFLY